MSWIDASSYILDGVRYPVCYRHLTRMVREENGYSTWFKFKLHPRHEWDIPLAADWISDFAFFAKKSGAVILASLENHYAHIFSIGMSDSGSTQLMMELVPPAQRQIVMPPRPEPQGREFYPRAFTRDDDLWANAVLDEIGPSPETIEQRRREEAIFRRRR